MDFLDKSNVDFLDKSNMDSSR